MAYNYENLPLLSKVKIGEQTYYLKDAEVRKLLDTFGTAVTYNVDAAVAEDGAGLVTAGAVHSYVTQYVTDITGGAMTFVGMFAKEEGKTDLEVLAAKVPSPAAGYVAIVGTAEYVYADGTWHLYGDEGIYATVAGVEADYVKKSLTIAGIDLKDAITADELKTALDLKALAHKDSASGSIDGVVVGIKDAAYTPAGSVEVKLNQTSTPMASTGSFTPAGTVSGNVTAAGTVAIARDDANGVAVSGTVAAPTITVTPSTAEVQHIDSLGQLPSYTAAQYTAPSVAEASSQFASEGLVAAIDENDAEMLVFSAAGKSAALTSTGFNAGSYTAAQFDAGKLPTLGAAQTVVTGIASATSTAPVFTGDKFGATFSGQQVAISAAFAGQEGAVNVSGNYDKAGVESAAFAGTEATISHEVTTGSKTVTVQ